MMIILLFLGFIGNVDIFNSFVIMVICWNFIFVYFNFLIMIKLNKGIYGSCF